MSDGWRHEPPTRPVFELVAALLCSSEDGVPTTVLEAGPAWRTDAIPERPAGPVVWGNVPAVGGSARAALTWAGHRERALRHVRRRHGPNLRRVHRLPPAVLHRQLPPRLRGALLGGALCEIAPAPYRRIIDEVLADAGAATQPEPRLRPSRDGSVLATVRGRDGRAMELRAVAAGGRRDPARNADALETLAAHGVPHVPRLLGRGVAAGASWTTETRLPGRLVREPTPRLWSDAIHFCAALPRSDVATSLRERMHALAERYPRWATLARQVADRADGIPGVVQHGDFWVGNLLVTRRGHLIGVIDWDTWHPAGLPGTDLVQLEAMDRRRRTGEEIGALWLCGAWRSTTARAAVERLWRSMGLTLTDEALELLGIDWWAGQLFKRQRFALREGWIEANIDAVLAAIGGSR